MRHIWVPAAVLSLAFLTPATGGLANGPVQDEENTSCRRAAQTCRDACQTRLPSDSGARLGCEARCAADEMQCETTAVLDEALPRIEAEADRWQAFIENFLTEFGRKPPVVPESGEENI